MTPEHRRRVLWLVRSGEGGEVVDQCVSNGVAAVGYPTVGDVRERTRAEVLAELKRARNRTDFETLAQRLVDFATRIKVGDFVVTSDGARRQLVVGRANGTYEWRETSPIPGMRHLLPVEWLGRIDWEDLTDEASTTLVRYPRTILEITDPNLVVLGDQAAAGELLPLTPSRAGRARSRATAAGRSQRGDERLCEECWLWKNASQFDGSSRVCNSHAE